MTTKHRNPILALVRKLCALMLNATLAAGACAQVAPPATKVKVERGKVLELSLVTPLDSATSKEGEQIDFSLTRPLVSEGIVVLKKDTVVHGRITKVRRAGSNCQWGHVEWKLEKFTAADGKQIKLQVIGDYMATYGNEVLDQVQLPTAGEKARPIVAMILLAPIILVDLILMLPVAVAMTAEGEGATCRKAGIEEVILPGKLYCAAVSREVRVAPQP